MVQFTYHNKNLGMVVLKCIGSNNFFIEKVIFPNEIFNIYAPEGAKVEIWGLESYGPKLEKRIRVISQETSIAA
tara:strand:- start:703 stop:924 length:222 start_codon:yes stop_codon:yes gene_type:complete